jgi:6,7-dimethyl-8-ribityllumazine synthase
MTGEGAPTLPVDGTDVKVAVVATLWHTEVTEALLTGALRTLETANVPEPTIIRVPGAFELPVVAQRAAVHHDVVICLGVIIRGGTRHFDYICTAVTDGLTRVALDTGVPMGFGVLTCDTEEQALDRCGRPESKGDKGREATEAALATLSVLRMI